MLGEALAAARAIGHEKYRFAALAALAPRLAELGHPAEALEAARAIGDERSRSEALAALAPRLAPTERDQVLREAVAAARAIGDERSRSRRWPRWPPTDRAVALRGGGGSAGDRGRVVPLRALAALAPRLAPTERDQALREALAAARAIGHERSRSRALAALAPHLTAPLLGEALEAARAIGDEGSSRSAALAALAPRLAPTERDQALREAVAAARAIEFEGSRSRALAALAPHLTAPLLGEAVEAARAIGDERSRSRALAALAPRLAPTERDQALREALEAARAIGDEGSRSAALAALAPRLDCDRCSARRWRQRGRSGTRSPGRGAGRAGPPPGCAVLGEALEAARAIKDERSRSAALAALAPRLAPTERDQACARRWRRRGRSGTSCPGPRCWPRWPPAWRSGTNRPRRWRRRGRSGDERARSKRWPRWLPT